MVTLRIQELAEAKGITLEQLSQDCCISVEKIHQYTAESIAFTQEMETELSQIAQALNLPIWELVKPTENDKICKLKILELAREKGVTLNELSAQLEIHPAILFFYSTQWLYPEQLLGSNHQKNLQKISVTLGCCIEDLKDIEINISTLTELELNQIYEPFQEENKEQDNAESIIKSSLSNNENLSSLPSDFLELTLSSPILESFHRWESQGSMAPTSSFSCLKYLACLKVTSPENCGPKPTDCNVWER